MGAVRDMPSPQQAWKRPTPTTESTIIGSQSRLRQRDRLTHDGQHRKQEETRR